MIVVGAILVAGCTSTAGPFVTNISSDGDGNLVVEKCMISLQRQINTVDNESCNSHKIKISSPSSSGRSTSQQ